MAGVRAGICFRVPVAGDQFNVRRSVDMKLFLHKDLGVVDDILVATRT